LFRGPPRGSDRPSSRTSSGPRTENSIALGRLSHLMYAAFSHGRETTCPACAVAAVGQRSMEPLWSPVVPNRWQSVLLVPRVGLVESAQSHRDGGGLAGRRAPVRLERVPESAVGVAK